jgi:hypothetical protein
MIDVHDLLVVAVSAPDQQRPGAVAAHVGQVHRLDCFVEARTGHGEHYSFASRCWGGYDSIDFDSRQGVVEPNDTPRILWIAEGEPNVPFLLTLDPSDLAYWIICLSRIV